MGQAEAAFHAAVSLFEELLGGHDRIYWDGIAESGPIIAVNWPAIIAGRVFFYVLLSLPSFLLH